MLSRHSLRGLLLALACALCVVFHVPIATATGTAASVERRCPIHTLGAFVHSARSLSLTAPKLRHLDVLPKVFRSNTALAMSATVEPETQQQQQAPVESTKKSKQDRQASAAEVLDVHCMGLSIHHAAVDVREKLAIKQDDWTSAAQELVEFSEGLVEEAAVLSTCNRFELYMSSRDPKAARRAAASWLASRSDLTQGVLRRNLFMLSGEDAGWHLLRVSGGLDSLVVGEGQILSQVSACYQAAISEEGCGGKVLARMLNQAVAAGKRVRSETAISKGAVSISSAAVEFSTDANPRDLGKPLDECEVVIVGAGTMSRLLVTHLKSHGVTRIVLVNRSVGPGSRAAELAAEHEEIEWEFRTMDQMYDTISQADVVYMSTASEDPLVTVDGLTPSLEQREEPLSIVDISVPRNVEKAVDTMPGVFSYNVDHLKAVVARNTAARRREIIEAEELLKGELQDFLGWHQSLGAVPTIARLQERAEFMRQEELTKNSKKLKSLSDKELEAVDRLSRGIVNKLLHGPMSHLRAPQGVDDKRRTLSTLNALFKLDEEDKGKNGKKGGKGKK
mmetsp:Transcript_27053/g.78778  ORF Transcript_27053/g.78778 Transcript_27053/m.78778 type:complete len:563 (-) Transcript_27053:287-1975(-)